MTIIGIGIDIIENIRIKTVFSCFEHKFAKRILSKNEWRQYIIQKNYISFLAKRFSVKEAASKALGTGMKNRITFNQFELYKNKNGKPKLRFLKNAKKMFEKIKCKKSYVTISDQVLYTCALVILES